MRSLLLAASLLALAGCATAPSPSPKTPVTTQLDPDRFYTGTWYEIGRRPMKLTDGCVAGGTTYERLGPDRVKVFDFCHAGSPTGKLKSLHGMGRIAPDGTFAKLHVRYRLFGFLPVPRDYWVLQQDPAGQWFISADPKFENLWLYTRSPRPSAAEVADLKRRASALGYDVSLLEFPATAP